MMTLVIGGSGSGKSAYAESLLDGYAEKYYVATMLAEDEEARKKIGRHRALRAGKGFVTIEQPRNLAELVKSLAKEGVVLLECVSNLVANEMFMPSGIVPEEVVAHKVLDDICTLSEVVEVLVVVSNNVFEDGICYDETTMAYLRALATVNTGIARMADGVTEVVVGIPIVVKEQ